MSRCGTIRANSYTADILKLLAQSGAMCRQTISQCIFKSDGDRIIDCRNSISLTKAMERLMKRTPALVIKVAVDGRIYYTLTKEGWNCVNELGLAKCPGLEVLSAGNAKHMQMLIRNANGIRFCRTMFFITLPEEKPSFAAFANALGSETRFYETGRDECYQKDVDLERLLTYGVFYTTGEIRSAYSNSSVQSIGKTHTRSLGILFTKEGMTVVHEMNEKREVMMPRTEESFIKTVYDALKDGYEEAAGMKPLCNIIIAAHNTSYLPTFFHGCVDGIEKKPRPGQEKEIREILWEGRELGGMKMGYFAKCDHVFMLPGNMKEVDKRRAFEQHSREEDEAKKIEYQDKHPEDKSTLLVCRFPDLKELYNIRKARISVTVIGPGTPYEADLLSRCLRTLLVNYISYDTLEDVPFRRYNESGLPLIGNTDRTDHDAPLGILSKNDPFFDNPSARGKGRGHKKSAHAKKAEETTPQQPDA